MVASMEVNTDIESCGNGNAQINSISVIVVPVAGIVRSLGRSDA